VASAFNGDLISLPLDLPPHRKERSTGEDPVRTHGFLSSHFDADAEIFGYVFSANRQFVMRKPRSIRCGRPTVERSAIHQTDGEPGLLRARRRQDGIGGSVNNQHRRFEPKQI